MSDDIMELAERQRMGQLGTWRCRCCWRCP